MLSTRLQLRLPCKGKALNPIAIMNSWRNVGTQRTVTTSLLRQASMIRYSSYVYSKSDRFINPYESKLFPPILSKRFSTEKKPDASGTDSSKTGAETEPSQQKQQGAMTRFDDDDYDDYYQEPQTAKEKVAFYTAILLRLVFLGLGVALVAVTAQELFPGRMSPNSLFNEVFEILRYNEDVMLTVGSSMKAYGKDHGGRAEGRRNFVDSYGYKAEDGSKRMRVRFNIKGSKGKVVVWAEVSDKMPANEYVYVVFQDARTGKVYTVSDNRDRLEAELDNNADPSATMINKFFLNKK